MDISHKTILFSLMVLCVFKKSIASCPMFQYNHTVSGKSVCCEPVLHCPVGHEIVFCDMNGGKDVCRPCENGYVNWYNTSSLDSVRRKCFLLSKEHNESCPVADTHPTEDREYCDHMNCKCQNDNCYHGDPCLACHKRTTPCGVNEEMNIVTGKCTPCQGPLMYNPEEGCSPCMYNETAWRLSEMNRNATSDTDTEASTKPASVEMTEGTTEQLTNKTEQIGDTSEAKTDAIMIPVIILICVLVAAGVLIALFLYAKKKAKKGDQTSFPAVIYTRFCSREQQYKTDQETMPLPAGGSDETTQNIYTKPSAAVSPMTQGACGTGDGITDSARMELLKNGNGATCETENEQTTDCKQENN